jgi:hypothetical protein
MLCGFGGTGIRTGLRSRRSRGHEGSTPSIRISNPSDVKEERTMSRKSHDEERSF